MARNKKSIYRSISLAGVLLLWLAGTTGVKGQANPLSILDSNGIHIRVAAAQFELKPDLEANLAKINAFLEEAAEKHVDLIVFPELGLTGYPPPEYTSISYIHQDRTEAALKSIQKKAARYHMAIAIGAGWKDEQDIWRNRAFFIDEKGKILATYDKIQQTDHERKFFVDGDRLDSFGWRGIRVGMLICMDMRYPELWRLLRKEDVGLMLHLVSAYSARAWKVPVLRGTMQALAASNGFFIVSSNNAGPIPMVNSAIYNPRGIILTEAIYAVEQLIFADIIVGKPGGFVDFKNNIYRLENVSKTNSK